jgi:hypothetical protein
MQSSLELSPDSLFFEPTTAESVFFDDGNHQVITFRPFKTSGMILKCDANNMSQTVLCLTLSGNQTILSIKFSLDNKLVAIQRLEKSIEIYSFNANRPELNALLTTKKFRGIKLKLIDFVWISSLELLVVLNKRLELFRFSTDTNWLEPIRMITLSDSLWYAWCKVGHLALIASQRGAVLTPFVIKHIATLKQLPPLIGKIEYWECLHR